MGLDWCLNTKPKPGREEEYARTLEAYDKAEEELEYGSPEYKARQAAYEAVACSPHETLGVPRIGIDQAATDYFVNEIMPGHREAAKKKPDDDKYRQHWEQTDEALLADAHGEYVPALVDEYDNISTITAYGPFRAMAGAFSFRGKVIGHSPLLSDDLQNGAYADMSPPEMADYAGRIEACAIERVSTQHGGVELLISRLNGAPSPTVAVALREWAEQVRDGRDTRAKALGYEEGMFGGWTKPGTDGFHQEDGLDYSTEEELSARLLTVLDGARWLRFWADLGHSMHAWS